VTASPHPLDTPITRVLNALKGVRPNGQHKWKALCPAHGDRTPSLDVKLGNDGRVLMICRSDKGCDFKAIVAAAGLTVPDTFPAKLSPAPAGRPFTPQRLTQTYDYVDEDGVLVYQSCRYEPKDFRQRRPDGKGGWVYEKALEGVRRVLYRLPDIIEAAASERPIYLVEGEKDADTLASLGYAATTNAGGAKAWREEYAATLKGAAVVILPDNDDVGRAFAEQAAASLVNAGCQVQVVKLPGLPEKGDVTDWLDSGHTLDELAELVGKTRHWTPAGKKRRRWRLDEILSNDSIMRPPPPVVPYVAWGGRSTLFASAEKAGKSTFGRFIASQVTMGGSVLGEPCTIGSVLWVGLEEGMSHFARDIRRFGPDALKVEYIDRTDLPTDPRERPLALREEIGDMEPTLTLVDTLIAWGEGAISDMSASAQTAPIVNALTSIAHETGTAMILFHHARRSDGAYRDSSAIGGAVDVIAEMFVPDEEKDPTLRKLRVKGRMGMLSAQFRFDGDTYVLDHGDEAPLDFRVREFVRSKIKCSIRDVVDGVKGRSETITCAVAQMVADGRLLDLTPGRKHRTLCVPDSPQSPIRWET
jgi:putative DNA primase/helicase